MTSTAYELTRCPVCDGADTDEIATREDIHAELEALWVFHQRRLRSDTPPDALTDRLAFSQDPPIRLVRCRACGTVYRNPRERAHELRDVYGRNAPPAETLQMLHDAQRMVASAQAARLRQAMGRTGTVIELGSYAGGFLAAARDAGLRAEGVDINEQVNDYTRGLGFTVTTGDLEAIPATHTVDAVVILNCFEQLPDPRHAARLARRRLAPGGVIALRVPNGACYAALVTRARHGRTSLARAVLAWNNLLSFPYRHGFTPAGLVQLVEEAGFTVIEVRGDALVSISDRWTRRWARTEERVLKEALRMRARMPGGAASAPWIELYARVA